MFFALKAGSFSRDVIWVEAQDDNSPAANAKPHISSRIGNRNMGNSFHRDISNQTGCILSGELMTVYRTKVQYLYERVRVTIRPQNPRRRLMEINVFLMTLCLAGTAG